MSHSTRNARIQASNKPQGMIVMPDDSVVYVVGNDTYMATSFERLLTSVNIKACIINNPIDFIRSFTETCPCCVVLEMRMPRLSGLELLTQIKQRRLAVPAIVVTAYGEVTSAVRAMKLGAVDFFEKPVNEELLLECVQNWIGVNRAELQHRKTRMAIEAKLAKLSQREMEVLQGIISGKLNKEIASALDVTPKAIELYRSKLMSKMEAPSLAALIRETLCTSVSRAYQCNAASAGDRTRFQCVAAGPMNVEKSCADLMNASPCLRKTYRT
jgi:two-component system, LuxR family, response regulator FixJ